MSITSGWGFLGQLPEWKVRERGAAAAGSSSRVRAGGPGGVAMATSLFPLRRCTFRRRRSRSIISAWNRLLLPPTTSRSRGGEVKGGKKTDEKNTAPSGGGRC